MSVFLVAAGAGRGVDRRLVDQAGLRVVTAADAVVRAGHEDPPVGELVQARVVQVGRRSHRLTVRRRVGADEGPLDVQPVTRLVRPGVGRRVVPLGQPGAVAAVVAVGVGVADPGVAADGQDVAVAEGHERRVPASTSPGCVPRLGKHPGGGVPSEMVVVDRARLGAAPVLLRDDVGMLGVGMLGVDPRLRTAADHQPSVTQERVLTAECVGRWRVSSQHPIGCNVVDAGVAPVVALTEVVLISCAPVLTSPTSARPPLHKSGRSPNQAEQINTDRDRADPHVSGSSIVSR